MFEYMTVQDAAKLWGISVRRVQKLCEENRIDGIVLYRNSLNLIQSLCLFI